MPQVVEALCVIKTTRGSKFKQLTRAPERTLCYKSGPMIAFFIGLLTCLSPFFRSRYNLSLEILALRQQLAVLRRKHPQPGLRTQDRVFWILLRRLWPAWNNVLIIVKPETVVAWHRAGFRAPVFAPLKEPWSRIPGNGLLATDNDEIFPVKAKRCCGEARRCDISSANDMQNHLIIS
jgi:hypothetical protein